jgi:competence protein ComEC
MFHDRLSPNFSKFPMLWLASAFGIGILASSGTNVEPWAPAVAAAVTGCIAFAVRTREYAVYLVLAAFVAAGSCAAAVEKASVGPNRVRSVYDSGTIRSGDPVEVEGIITAPPEPSVDGYFMTVLAEMLSYHGRDLAASGNVRVFIPESASPDMPPVITQLKYGSRVRIACKLSREDAFLDPGVLPRRDVLDRQQIDAAGVVKSSRLIEKLADESVFLPLAWVYGQRAALIQAFRANLSPRIAGVMIASLLGDKYFLDKDTADLFRDGGTFHILVISGLHITFIGGLILLLLRRFTRSRWVQFLVTPAFLWAYTLAVGADVPVVRASLMFTVVLFSFALFRQISLLNSFGICALVLLVWRPSDLFDPSFQLTFVSVAAIVLTAYPVLESIRQIGSWTPNAKTPFPPNVSAWLQRLCETLYWNPDAWAIESQTHIWTVRIFKSPFMSKRVVGGTQRAVRYLFEGVLVSLIVQLWMLPLSVVYFHRVSMSSVILNLWVGVIISVESVVAVAGALVWMVNRTLAVAFFTIAELAGRLMLVLPRLFSDNGLASFRLPAYSGPGKAVYLLYALPLLATALIVNAWRPFELRECSAWFGRKALITVLGTLALLAAVIVFHPFSAPGADGRLHFDFLDVGQGDSALVTFPDGTTLLVDGGGRVNYRAAGDDGETFVPDTRGIGESVVSEFLWYRGYSRIDRIVATHADADHIQGLNDVARNFSVGSAAFGRTPPADPEFADLAAVLQKRGIPVETISRGESTNIGGVVVDVLYPIATDDPAAVSDNDHSVVLRFRMGNRTILMTGDIERTAENALVTADETLRSDVIKVPHHGSRTSSTPGFIEAVHPTVAIISVGRTSPFGHPHKEVVERWRSSGVQVMTTGERGMISISTNGDDLDVDTFQK